MPISQTYIDFFKRTFYEKHVILQGGRRSGKTFATFQYIAKYGELSGRLKVLVVCAEYQPLQRTMEDFTKCFGIKPHSSLVEGYSADTRGGVHWQFAHFSSAERAQGTDCDILFINEAINVKQEVFLALLPSVRRQVFYNFNPSRKGWILDYMTQQNTLITTWRDNAYLTDEQRAIFEDYKVRAMRPNATMRDKYAYEVYYLGNFANMVGAVFNGIEKISVDVYRNIPAVEVFGMDFGFATDGDPTTLVGCKYHNNRIYLHQYIYEQGLINDEELAHRLLSLGLNSETMIFADYGGMGRGRIYNLRTANNGKWTGDISRGFNVVNCIKTTIMDGISQMLAVDGITITDTSKSLQMELEGYELGDDGKPHGADHAIDASRYAFTYAKRL